MLGVNYGESLLPSANPIKHCKVLWLRAKEKVLVAFRVVITDSGTDYEEHVI